MVARSKWLAGGVEKGLNLNFFRSCYQEKAYLLNLAPGFVLEQNVDVSYIQPVS